jgi:hypothetical protein
MVTYSRILARPKPAAVFAFPPLVSPELGSSINFDAIPSLCAPLAPLTSPDGFNSRPGFLGNMNK